MVIPLGVAGLNQEASSILRNLVNTVAFANASGQALGRTDRGVEHFGRCRRELSNRGVTLNAKPVLPIGYNKQCIC